MNRAQLKNDAKQQIRGNIGILFLIGLVSGLVMGAVNLIPVAGSLATMIVITPSFSLAIISIYLELAKGKKPQVADLFSKFSEFWCAFKVTFLVGLFTLLWSLLLYIPGIIKALSYSMSMYILSENPEMSAIDAINESKRIMHGHKMDLFVLELSFIGWAFVGAVTFGIAYIWIIPYMQATFVNFYNEIKDKKEA